MCQEQTRDSAIKPNPLLAPDTYSHKHTNLEGFVYVKPRLRTKDAVKAKARRTKCKVDSFWMKAKMATDNLFIAKRLVKVLK